MKMPSGEEMKERWRTLRKQDKVCGIVCAVGVIGCLVWWNEKRLQKRGGHSMCRPSAFQFDRM